MNNQVIRNNRINQLFQYALSLAKVEGETYDSIKRKVQAKAETIVSKSTAIEYTDTVFARIERMKQ